MSGRKYAKQGYTARKKKRDANELPIVQALEAIPGVMVVPLDRPVDLLVGFQGVTHLLEVKNPEGKDRIEDSQEAFIKEWSGGHVHIVRNEAEAIRAIGASVSALAVSTIAR